MRILHTSDWHLGRTFMGVNLHDAHSQFVDHFVQLATNGYDAVVIAGDIYDRAIPPIDSLALFDTAMNALLDAGLKVIITSGNHDSFHRLGAGRTQLDRVGLHVRTHLEDYLWPVDAGECVFYGIPYLEPNLVAERLSVTRTHHAVISRVCDQIREHAAKHFPGVPTVVLAHAFVTGATPSESEREIDLGGLGNVGAEAFTGFDYVALGHLHRPQIVGACLAYPGSPLPYSFAEAVHTKQVRHLEISGTQVSHHAVDLPAFVKAVTVRGLFEEVRARMWPDDGTLVDVELTDPERVPGALQILRERIPRLIRMRWVGETEVAAPMKRVAARTDTQTFEEFIHHVTNREASPFEVGIFHQALQEADT